MENNETEDDIIPNIDINKKKTDEFIAKAQKIHGNRYDYDMVEYIKAIIKVKIKCIIHGYFEKTPQKHLRGQGCSRCAKRSKNKTTSEFICEAIKVHSDEYDYNLVKYNGSKNNVSILCRLHGLFFQRPEAHLRGQGCRKCGSIILSNLKRKSQDKFINEANEVHGNKYDYTEVEYSGANTKVKIKCKIHGLYEQTPSAHISHKSGCPKCFTYKSENTMNEILKELYIENTFQKIRPSWLKYINGWNLEIDAYCEELKIGFEYQGRQHEKFVPYFHDNNIENFYNQQKKDIWKKERCNELNIKLICVPHNYSYQNRDEMKQFIERSIQPI